MYPFSRLVYQMHLTKRAPETAFDIFNELNNGSIPTLFNMGGLPFGYKVGLFAEINRNSWGILIGTLNYRFSCKNG